MNNHVLFSLCKDTNFLPFGRDFFNLLLCGRRARVEGSRGDGDENELKHCSKCNSLAFPNLVDIPSRRVACLRHARGLYGR